MYKLHCADPFFRKSNHDPGPVMDAVRYVLFWVIYGLHHPELN